MQYYLYFIPAQTFPTGVVKLNKDVYVFPSNKTSGIAIYNNCLCIAINFKKNEKERQQIISEFITALSLFRSEWVAIQWLSTLQLNSGELVSSIKVAEKKYLSSKNLNRHDDVFTDLKVHAIALRSYSRSLIDVFNKLLKLDRRKFIYRGIHYFAGIDALKMTLNRIFDNVLFEQTQLFQLFESTMYEYEDPNVRKKVKCEICGRDYGGSISQRIESFLKHNPALIPNFKKVSGSRNKFSHALSGKSLWEYHEPLSDNNKTASEVSRYDLKDGDGAIQSVHIARAFLHVLLIEKLLSEK